MKIRCYDIDWDTDGEKVDLPDEIVIDIEEEKGIPLEDTVNMFGADALSDLTGWCVNKYQWEEEKP